MTDTSKEAVEKLWKEYCDASSPIGELPGGVEEFDVGEMDRRAWELYELASALSARVVELGAALYDAQEQVKFVNVNAVKAETAARLQGLNDVAGMFGPARSYTKDDVIQRIEILKQECE